jgi:predicted nucleic acid-binding protein
VPSVQFFAPDLCYADAEKYLPMLFEKRNLKADDALDVLERLTCLIQLVDSSLYGLYEQAAKQRIAARDANDWPVVAVALMLDCPIWTEDADFFGAGIATWTSDRVHLYLD